MADATQTSHQAYQRMARPLKTSFRWFGKRRTKGRLMKKQIAGMFCLTLSLAMAGQVSAQPASAQPSPTLVSVAGRQVEVVQMGKGSPTLVLESGGGETVAQWNGILPELAKQTRVISYSRAGFGRSSASANPGSPQLSVAELHQLLQALGEKGPVVIAGHSWGGLLARLYASTFPEEVAGLVLIDGSHEAQFARWEAAKPGLKLADSIRARASQLPAFVREFLEQGLRVQAAQRVEGMKPLPDFPLAVITALKPCPLENQWECRDPKALAIWRQLHDEWTARSTSSLHIVSARTGHYVMYDQPQLIVDAVSFVLSQARAKTEAAPGITMSEADLKKFVGKYAAEAAPFEVNIEIVGGKLKATLPGQLSFTLLPVALTRFQIEGAPAGFFLSFEVDGNTVKSMKLEQSAAPALTLLPKRTN
jgi:pimeloyl-ACP methyl ester carboxylesterase